jgi:hypothetical protein
MKPLRSHIADVILWWLGLVSLAKLARHRELRALRSEMSTARSFGIGVSDWVALYEHVLRRRPKFILELGAGQSSAVIALAAQNSGYKPVFVAVEENPEWLAHHRLTIPMRFLPSIELIQLDAFARDFDGTKAAFYKNVPRLPYELVHVDGPANPRVGAQVSCDVIDLVDVLAARCLIVFDGREKSARFARPYLERAGFRMRRHPLTLSYEFVRDDANA